MENSMQDPQKIKNRTLYDPAIPFLGTYPKKMKSFKKDICTLSISAALFTKTKTWRQPRYPQMDESIKKMWSIHIDNGILYNHKKKGILPFVRTWMDLEVITLSEMSNTRRQILNDLFLKNFILNWSTVD